jgi:predicted ATPase
MQNKPNFRKAKMNLTFYSTKDYENKSPLRTPAKQTQSNPISKRALAQGGLARHSQLAIKPFTN